MSAPETPSALECDWKWCDHKASREKYEQTLLHSNNQLPEPL